MHGPWTMLLSIAPVGIAVLAELNLLRLYVPLLRRRDARARQPGRPTPSGSGAAPYAAAGRRREGTRAARYRPLLAGMVLPCMGAGVAAGQNAPEPRPGSAFSLQLNLDVTNAYFYHGIVQEDSGLIAQPAAKVTMNIHDSSEFKLDLILATWNSFQSQKTNAGVQGDFTPYWYESDLITGFAITSGAVSLTTTYVFLTSPSDAYQTVQELDFNLAYDDTALLGAHALHPYALLGIETGANASDGADSPTGVYLELGVAPGFWFDAGNTPIAITFPVALGLSLKDYYENAAGENDVFGFVQVGVKASIPLPIAERYGKWSLNAGLAGMYLGDNTSEYDGGQREQFIASVGLQLTF